ncbi:MAG: class II glutamine amidotransferase [Thermodesulfobacteriota bacterium]
MCRFVLYLGEDVALSSLITEPENSIIHQSFHSHEREEPLNGDGFGVAWYAPDVSAEPAVFKDITPAWNNINLINLARVISSPCVLGHVRAATPGLPVIQLNCHPFVFGPFSFMHNGRVGGFSRLRRSLMRSLSDRAFNAVSGSTDSEFLFALFLDFFESYKKDAGEAGGESEEDILSAALMATILEVERLKEEAGVTEPSFLNLVVSDGTSAVISRYVSPGGGEANTLYVHAGGRCECSHRHLHLIKTGGPRSAVIAASEPLTDEEVWMKVPSDNVLVISDDLHIELRPIM